MVRFFFASLLFLGALASCAPRQAVTAGVTVTPLLVKLSDAAPRGGLLTVQGRYLGGPSTGRVRLGADAAGGILSETLLPTVLTDVVKAAAVGLRSSPIRIPFLP